MEINFTQIGRNLAEAGVNPSKAMKQNLASESVIDKQNTQDLAQSAEKDVSTERRLSSEEITAAVEGLSDFANTTNRQLNFSIDEGSDKQVVKVTDAESGEVIRQIPSEEILRLSERLRELQSDLGATVGILFNKQV